MSNGQKAWSWCHAFCQSDLPPTTKHVLHTLHMFMNSLGESCFPAVDEIVTYSGLSKRAVLQHLKVARDAGWIEMQQHGFRGRRWRRQEYVPRWPERDLTAACPPERPSDGALERGCEEDRETGRGGASPAPRQTNEVVHDVQRGGAPPAPEVVHEGNRVIETIPVTNPKTNPIERERAGAGVKTPCPDFGHGPVEKGKGLAGQSDGPSPNSGHGPSATRGTWKRRLKKAHKDWPSFLSDSEDAAEREWFALSEEDRAKAADLMADYVLKVRASGRTKFCAFAVYLKEKRWQRLPEKALKPGGAAGGMAAPYGKAWGALRFADLMREPYGPPPKLTSVEERLCAAGTYCAADLLRQKLPECGWPKVNRLHQAALTRRKGAPADPRLAGLADLFGKVAKGSDLYQAWKALHQGRGWPWLGEDRDLPDWIWMPDPPDRPESYESPMAAVKAALARFEQAHADLAPQEAAQ